MCLASCKTHEQAPHIDLKLTSTGHDIKRKATS